MTKQKKNRIYVIGLATAQQFVDEGAYVFITGRPVQSDSSKLNDLDKVYKLMKEQKGKLDILFANADVASVLFTVQKALPLLNEGASIILNASVVSTKGAPGSSVYFASKAAVCSFTRCFCVDLKERKIRVNAVSPEASKSISDSLTSSTVLGRLGHPIEIAKAVLFLASDASPYVTSIELFVDGSAEQI
ncbi:unnamed protein product [Adineta steineri]|uniref:Dehydrogenase/reductase SDR family member 6 n=1 Tax=Adineta steineri TaxID=433720 RepID=A0A814UJW8_9BILA|nr:unnamed protein product [Adineta steineri]